MCQKIYDALSSRGFSMSGWSDKWWKRADGLLAHVYGAGSKLLIRRGDDPTLLADGAMADVLAKIDDGSWKPEAVAAK